MAKINDASVTTVKSVNNSKIKAGDIKTNSGASDSENNTSVKAFGEVSDSELGGGSIDETLPSIDLKELIAELKEELKPLLNEIAGNPRNKKPGVAVAIIHAEIDENPTLKQRLIGALKAGGTEALKAIFNNPAFSIPVETIKGYLEPS